MNVATQIKGQTADILIVDDIVEIKSRIHGHNACLSDLHEKRHAANMAAWRERHARHMAAGEFDIAANIMTMKIIPNIS